MIWVIPETSRQRRKRAGAVGNSQRDILTLIDADHQ